MEEKKKREEGTKSEEQGSEEYGQKGGQKSGTTNTGDQGLGFEDTW